MNGRRRKDEPFNPFAPNASQKARDRKERTPRPAQRPRTTEPVKPTADMAAKQKAAMEALRQRKEAEEKKKVKPEQKATTHKPSQQPKPAPTTSIQKPDSREDRLASLRAKSAATAKFAKEAQDARNVETGGEILSPEITELEVVKETGTPKVEKTVAIEVPQPIAASSANVFKTITTEIKKSETRNKRRRHGDKKGGGRQPQSRKLDRRKYLEYKYIARDLLDNDAISEEHRSNILGQIWAKGERTGVADAIEFINDKEKELIIPTEVADEFRKIVKRYTTKR
jgi:hypothetical protein